MMDISLGGLLGAFIGTVLAAIAYGPLIEAVERWMKNIRSADDRSDDEVALLRRGVLACDLLVLAGFGYWIGNQFADRIG